MSKLRSYNISGLNLLVSPFLQKEGDLIRSVNVTNFPIGAKAKRSGYATYLGTNDNSPITALWDWHRADGTTFWNYKVSAGVIYSSQQGTGDWTACVNGTITNGATPGHAVLADTMILGDGTAATRHTTDGTTFVDTTAAPYAQYFEQYQQRIYAGGTGSDLFYSTVGTPSDWITDSSSINIPGAGKINGLTKVTDRLITTKNSGEAYRWDGYVLYDLATNLAPTSPYSIKKIEDYAFGLNREGYYGFDGNDYQAISMPIVRQIYNDDNTGIAGSVFDTAPSTVHNYNYITSVGTVSDDLTDETMSNCSQVYDYQHNEWTNFVTAHKPTAWHSFKDINGDNQLIFGNDVGQCYKFSGTCYDDDGSPIEAIMEGVINFGQPDTDKQFYYLWAFANPGCQAHVQVAISNTYTKEKLKWIDIGQLTDGVAEFRFPPGTDGKLMFWKVTDNSSTSRFTFYGFTVDFDFQERQ